LKGIIIKKIHAPARDAFTASNQKPARKVGHQLLLLQMEIPLLVDAVSIVFSDTVIQVGVANRTSAAFRAQIGILLPAHPIGVAVKRFGVVDRAARYPMLSRATIALLKVRLAGIVIGARQTKFITSAITYRNNIDAIIISRPGNLNDPPDLFGIVRVTRGKIHNMKRTDIRSPQALVIAGIPDQIPAV
jgi:hypothetical protein